MPSAAIAKDALSPWHAVKTRNVLPAALMLIDLPYHNQPRSLLGAI